MYCYQCEQRSTDGCHFEVGICGKTDRTAVLQDVLVYVTEGIASYAHLLRGLGAANSEYNIFTLDGLFTTVTNVNFDEDKVMDMIRKGSKLLAKAAADYRNACTAKGVAPEKLTGPATFEFVEDKEDLINFGRTLSIEFRKAKNGADITGIEELVMYGLKGLAAYAEHAQLLDYTDESIFADIQMVLHSLTQRNSAEDLLGLALKTGELNFRVMELLDRAHTTTFGHPTPAKVRTTPVKGKAILVSGHDLKDMIELLKQTEGKGINVYTHSEMLPAHGYPELKKFKHLVGNFGGAWQDQVKEFAKFPGAIYMTTNCIQKPTESYINNIFTGGLVQWPGAMHIENRDFTPLIKKALEMDGFSEDAEPAYTMTGFGHNAVLGVADKVVEAVKAGDIKHFFLVGGCDGAKSGRNYYTDFAMKAPKDTVILTLACGKFRFNKLEFGDIGGIPRLLDVGQCNDAYSAIKIAVALAEVFKTDVNSLPLSLILSWYEQKAVAILLTLLHLGIKNIRIGPSLPAFLEPNVLNILVEKFNLMPITTAEADLKAILG